MMKHLSILLIAVMATLLISASCKPNGNTHHSNGGSDSTATVDTTQLPTGGIKPLPVDPKAVQQKLIDQYRSGEVEQCLHESVTVYKCSRNAPDAGSEIYASNGDLMGRCYYSTRQVDPICERLTDCKTIYRVAKNIWGKPEVKWAGDN